MDEKLYRVFYINHDKFFVSIVDEYSLRTAITKYHKNFSEECLWVTFDNAQKIIKKNKNFDETWGIVDKEGRQLIAGKFDGILKMK